MRCAVDKKRNQAEGKRSSTEPEQTERTHTTATPTATDPPLVTLRGPGAAATIHVHERPRGAYHHPLSLRPKLPPGQSELEAHSTMRATG